MRGSCDRISYWLANRVTYVCGAAHFSQSASTLQSEDIDLILNSGKACLRKTRKCYPRNSLSGVPMQRAG